jgi:hypothetical protein
VVGVTEPGSSTSRARSPLLFRHGEQWRVPYSGRRCAGPLALTLLFGFSDQPRAECDTREHHTIPWFAALGETLVRAIGMQADRLFLPIEAADGTAPVLGMEEQRAPLETQGARAAPWFASPSLCRLQRVQLATHEPGAYHVPHLPACGLVCSTDRCCHDPCVYRMGGEGLLRFALGLLQTVLLAQFLGLVSLAQVDSQAHLAQEALQVLFADLHRTKRSVPLPSLARTADGLDILDDHIGERQDLLQLPDHSRFRLPTTAR